MVYKLPQTKRMASKGLKIIINGVASYVPNTQTHRKYWMEHNAILNRPPKIRDVESHLATVIDATPEEVELYLFPKAKPRAAIPGLPNLADENKALRGEIDQLKNMMLQFMANQGGSQAVATPVQVTPVTREEVEVPIASDEPEEDDELLDIFGSVTTKRGRPKKS